MTSTMAPVISVFIGRNQDAWRIYFDLRSWCPPMLRMHLDEQREGFPLREPDLEELDRHMWETDSPYERRLTKAGGIELSAKGRSAVTLAVWLEAYLTAGRPVT